VAGWQDFFFKAPMSFFQAQSKATTKQPNNQRIESSNHNKQLQQLNNNYSLSGRPFVHTVIVLFVSFSSLTDDSDTFLFRHLFSFNR